MIWNKAPLLLLALTALFIMGCQGLAQGWTSPIVANNRIYAVTQEHQLVALNPDARGRGEPFPAAGEWAFPSGEDPRLGSVYGSPTLVNGTLYITTYSETGTGPGQVHAVDAASGRPLNIDYAGRLEPLVGELGNLVGSPTVADGVLYLSSSSNYVLALDVASGDPKWPIPFEADNKVWGSVTLDGAGGAFVGSLDHTLYGLNSDSGQQRWSFATAGAIATAPLYHEGALYFGSADGNLYAVNARSGGELWRFSAASWPWSTPFLDGDTIYLSTLDGNVHALDVLSGQPKWLEPYETAGPISASPIKVGAVLVVASQDGGVYGLNPISGERSWAYKTDPSAAIFASMATDGATLYVAPQNNRIIALDAANGTPKWVHRTDG